VNVITRLDMSLALDSGTYKKELLQAQGELGLLSRRLRKRERSLILVFEGPRRGRQGRRDPPPDRGHGHARLPGPVGGGADG
jgi:hypothetical protein